jgi:hypothetical protein
MTGNALHGSIFVNFKKEQPTAVKGAVADWARLSGGGLLVWERPWALSQHWETNVRAGKKYTCTFK